MNHSLLFSTHVHSRGVLPVVLFALAATSIAQTHAPRFTAAPISNTQAIAKSYSSLPLSFESNQGQAAAPIKYLSRGAGYSVFVTDKEAILELTKTDSQLTKADSSPTNSHAAETRDAAQRRPASVQSDSIHMQLIGASPTTTPTAGSPLPGTVNYFLGSNSANWHTDIPTYGRINYADVYPGINLVYYGNQSQLEFDFQLTPNADPSPIRLHFAGAKNLSLSPNGDLILHAPNGEISFRKPIIYQTINGQHQPVDGGFRLLADNSITFILGSYNHDQPLTIDPILAYSTYLGSTGQATAIAVDSSGNAYVTGFTDDYLPTTSGSFDSQIVLKNNVISTSAFITKFNSTGTALIYSTYIGGNASDQGNAIAVDANGNAYIAGSTVSTDFPTTPGAFQLKNNTAPTFGAIFLDTTGFVTELNSSGTALVYSTYLGGNTKDFAQGIVVDASGNAYVSGTTNSPNFPTTSGALLPMFPSTQPAISAESAFYAKLNNTGTALLYSTFLGGSCVDYYSGMAIDPSGNIYISGETCSPNFPITSGVIQTQVDLSAEETGFLTKFSAPGTSLSYSTYLNAGGGPVAADASGNAYVTSGAVPISVTATPGAFQQQSNGELNVFLSKINSSATAVLYGTYLGGSKNSYGPYAMDSANAIAVDSSGDAIVVGSASSIDFPITPGAFQTQNQVMLYSGNLGTFVTKFNSTGTALLYSTYLSGNGVVGSDGDGPSDTAWGVALDSSGNVYLAGATESSDFPTSFGAFQPVPGNTFVTKLNSSAMHSLPATTISLTSGVNPQAPATPVTFMAQVQPTTSGATPTGYIAFSPDSNQRVVYPLDNTGSAAYTNSTLPSGSNYVSAYYLGDDNNAPSTTYVLEAITDSNTLTPVIITATSSANPSPFGQPVTFHISVQDSTGKSVPVGYVILSYNTTEVMGYLDASGNVSLTTSLLAVGSDAVHILFLSSNHAFAGNELIIFNQTITPLGVAPTPVFTPSAANTYISAQTVSITDADAAATVLIGIDGSLPGSGTYYGPFSLGYSETIAAQAVEEGYSPSPIVTVTYNIYPNGQTPTPTVTPASGTYTELQLHPQFADSLGSAVFYYTTDGTTPTITSAQASTTLPLFTSSATVKFIAVAPGYTPSSVVTAAYVLNTAPDFILSTNPTAIFIAPNAPATTAVNLTPYNSFSQTTTFSCAGLPALVSCAFSPATLTPTTSTGYSTTLTVSTSAVVENRGPASTPFGQSAPIRFGQIASVALLVICVRFRKRNWISLLLLCIIGIVSLLGLGACGGGTSNSGSGSNSGGTSAPTPVVATVTVTATAGSLAHSTTFSLTVY